MQKGSAQQWLERRISARNDIDCAIVVLEKGRALEEVASWSEPGTSNSANEPDWKKIARDTIKARCEVRQSTQLGEIISTPILHGGQIVGVWAVRMKVERAANDSLLNTRLAQSQSEEPAAANPVFSAKPTDRIVSPPPILASVGSLDPLDLLDSAFGFETLNQAATQLATELATRLEFDRVTLCLMQGQFAKVIAVSHSAEFHANEALLESLRALAEEAVDQDTHLQYPASEDSRSMIVLAHSDHAIRQGSSQIFSFILVANQKAVGALICERRSFVPLTQAQQVFLPRLVKSLGPLLAIKVEQSQSVWSKVKKKLNAQIERIFGTDGRTLKTGLVCLVILLLLLPLVPVSYRLTADARIEGGYTRVLVAPVDGFLKSVEVRPGDRVQAGAVLAHLVDDELRAEARRLESELGRHEASVGEGMSRQDRALVTSSQAKVLEVRAQLAVVDQQLERSVITAPIDGVITQGDLKQRLGAPLRKGETLMSMSPNGQFKVVVDLPDREAGQVAVGMKGELVLGAFAREAYEFQVQRVVSVSTQKSGRNVFEVEAKLVQESDPIVMGKLRPGMEGVAKIEAEKRSLYRAWGGRLIDWLRVKFWSWTN